MIRNQRQLNEAVRKRDEARSMARDGDEFAASVYGEFAEELTAEITEYQAIRDGYLKVFELDGIDGLADALVKARLACGWTQRQLAEALDVTEQMVQRDEAGAYERAALARIAEVADVLGYQLRGLLRPVAERPGGIVFREPRWADDATPAHENASPSIALADRP